MSVRMISDDKLDKLREWGADRDVIERLRNSGVFESSPPTAGCLPDASRGKPSDRAHGNRSDGTTATTAAGLLRDAAELVSGDRDRQHGAKARNFQNIANVWNALLGDQIKSPITAAQVGILMAGLKLARTMSGAFNIDDAIDVCGYAACYGEIAQGEINANAT